MRYEDFSCEKLTVGQIFNKYGNQITPGCNPSGGLDYYVDGNKSVNGPDGLSWGRAFSRKRRRPRTCAIKLLTPWLNGS